MDRLRGIPGVTSVASTVGLPGLPTDYQVEYQTTDGGTALDRGYRMMAQSRYVTPGYFETMRIPLIAGEFCREEPGVASMLVNQIFAQTYLAGQAVVGRRLIRPEFKYLPPGEIRGIVGDARESGMHLPAAPTVYSCRTAWQPGSSFTVRVERGDPMALASAVRHALREIEPRRSVYRLAPLSERIGDSYAQTRLRTLLLAFFALTAVSLAGVGLYGTLSYLVNTRQQEIGVRMALGALRRQIAMRYLMMALRVSLIGCAAGLGIAAASGKLIAGLLYGVQLSDPMSLVSVIAIVLAVTATASLLPAFRAARLDPASSLRGE